MCYSPTLIPNPNFGHKERMSFLHDCQSRYIPIPCGHCGECVAIRTAGIVQRVQMESLSGYVFFNTLTYNQESLPYHVCSDGVRIRYADYSDFRNMVKRLRKHNAFGRRFRYFGVQERGSLKGRPHFHVLWFLEKLPEDNAYTPINLERMMFDTVLKYWSRNYGSARKPEYRPLCTFVQRYLFGHLNSTYDLHFVTPSAQNGSSSDVSYYVTKYMLKDSDQENRLRQALRLNLPPDEFFATWQKVKSRSFSSLNFGFGIYDDINPRHCSKAFRLARLSALPSASYVRSCIARSADNPDEKTPKFYDMETGKSLPLSRYWYRFGDVYTMNDHLTFYFKNEDLPPEREFITRLLAEQKYVKNLNSRDDNNFDLIYGES